MRPRVMNLLRDCSLDHRQHRLGPHTKRGKQLRDGPPDAHVVDPVLVMQQVWPQCCKLVQSRQLFGSLRIPRNQRLSCSPTDGGRDCVGQPYRDRGGEALRARLNAVR